MKTGTIVRYSNPQPGEEVFRFVVVDNCGDRAAIALICDWHIKPVEVVPVSEITEAAALTIPEEA
jgi:hypothetical protein